MIIVRVSGSLGEQMFQYAIGRRLALIHRTALKLDIDAFESTPHNYLLDRFRIRASVAKQRDMSQLVNLHDLRRARPEEGYSAPYLIRTSIEDNPYLVAVRDDTYLTGQCWTLHYFRPIAARLREELRVKEPPSGLNRRLLQAIRRENSVALHLRHGDGAPPLDYYYRAAECAAERAPRAVFYLFCDDPAWCRDHFFLNHPVRYVEHNPAAQAYENFRLMRACRHHIAANTADSWWAAWLGEEKGSLTIAPKDGFPADEAPEQFLPARWIAL